MRYLYKSTINLEYWSKYLGRKLTYEEFMILKNAKSEQLMNEKIYEIYEHATLKNLYVPKLTGLYGNCIFESLQYYGLCEDVDNFRKGLATLLIAFKNKKFFIPDQELSLSELFNFTNSIEYVFCKNEKRLYKYNFDAMCIDLAMDSSWTRLNTELVLLCLTVLLNIKINIFHNNGHITVIKTTENEHTKDIYFGQINEIHYIPLDTRMGNKREIVCPKYRAGLKKFHKWAKQMAIEQNRTESSDDDSELLDSA